MILRAFQIEDENAVIDLWTRCGLVKSHNDPRKDIARKLKVNPKMFLVGLLEAKIIATVMVGYEGHRGWINYLAVSPECRMRGLGKRMMDVT
jgi:ribosomal protein S18 acetylase RimI-like enzyme|uniref:GNAT family N-acetyltransferase n=1 Tax=Cephaloticoccus sp. TaxID=1985742 RepID=UPI00404B5856